MTGILKGKKVAVLFGGPGPEREVSLRSGAAVARALRSRGALVEEIDVKDSSFAIPNSVDLAYNMIHGTFGEDGQIQEILERQGIPYTGEGIAGSQLAFDKILTKRKFDEHGVPTGRWHVIAAGQTPRFEVPFVVKSPRQGSSVGVHIVKDSGELDAALEDCFRFGDAVIVEEFFSGRELTVGILGDVALPVIEIVPRNGFYDYEHKYTKGASEYFVPAPIGDEATQAVQYAALSAKRALGLKIYSRVDVILASDGRLNVLEINTIPGMTETSLLPKAAAAAGLDFPELCERIASLSMQRSHH
jgi:D-alanine-D-alanine ligase